MFQIGQTFRRNTPWGSVEFYQLTDIDGKDHVLRFARREYTEVQKGVKVRVSVTPAEGGFLDLRVHHCRPYLTPGGYNVDSPYILSECVRNPRTLGSHENISKCFVHYFPESSQS